MPSNPLMGKFGPIVLLAVVQLVLVVAAPSTAPNAANSALGGSPYATTQSGAPVGTGPATGLPAGAVPAGGAGGAAGGTTTTAAGGGATAGASGGTTSGATTSSGVGGDTKHCVNGRQFDPKIDYYAPPCVPGTPGAADPNNGGATWPGVTNNKIEIVNYVADYGAEVDAILKAQGLYYDASQAKQWNDAYAKFINSHYQLYGRQIHIDTVQGNCRTVPPDYPCLTGDMDKIVSTYHPYGVLWSTTVCSQCFAELSRLHVVNFGGSGFSDAFHNANAPYSYDAGMSATNIELNFADWWCHQMTSQGGSGRTAIFAGDQNPAEDFRNKPRVLGVISTNDPDNENTVKSVLYPALKRGCGETVNHEYFYAQDINTATTQSQQSEQAMNTPTNPATSVLCLCDPVAPQFGQNAFGNNNYWPEAILGSDQTMDWDSIAQTYSSSDHKNDSLSCPKNGNGCGWDGAIGVGSDIPQTSAADSAAVKVYKAATNNGALPTSVANLDVFWEQYAMIATLIEGTGPILTPARMQASALHIPFRGGGTTGYPLRGFRNGSWCWTQDVRVVYWNANATSPYNGQKGHYIDIEGSRFSVGHFPSVKQPPAPTADKRRS
ncbi:MAG TPA: hypothetical protein VFH66_08635 [Mycobacteriales bacterium]|nr:hypothetical protein [Mycobacteriales bacterium]